MNHRTHRPGPALLAGALGAALLLTGCAAEVRSTGPKTDAASQTSPAPATDVDQELLERTWEEASQEGCVSADLPVDGSGVDDMVMCTGEVVLSTFDTGSSSAAQEILMDSLAPELPGHAFLTGETWSAFTDEGTARSMQASLGGTIALVSDLAPAITVSDVEGLVQAFEQHTGKSCDEEPQSDHGGQATFVFCPPATSMTFFDSPALLDELVEAERSTSPGSSSDQAWLVGENWKVESFLSDAQDLHGSMGGEVVRLD